MVNKSLKSEQYKDAAANVTHFYEMIPSAVQRFLASCNTEEFFDHVDTKPIPSQESVVQFIHQARCILFPGYFTHARLDPNNLEYYLGQQMTELFERLSKQIIFSIQHDCLRYNQPCSECIERSLEKTLQFIQTLPELRAVLSTDIRAALEGDPAAKSYDEIIFSYPGFFAITVYRIAHKLHELDVLLLPRMMTEYAHSLTGIDIHPGAKIEESFFIDHGTGVVIGETTEIGKRVRLYQGVTLGALSLSKEVIDRFRDKKRHPTIGSDVIIYSNATILGEKAVIGARSIIGGNVWITECVPPDTKVLLKQPELVYIGNNNKLVRKEVVILPDTGERYLSTDLIVT
ncbi:serine acetyltransferase [Thermodesulfobacteriota bacterium]